MISNTKNPNQLPWSCCGMTVKSTVFSFLCGSGLVTLETMRGITQAQHRGNSGMEVKNGNKSNNCDWKAKLSKIKLNREISLNPQIWSVRLIV